MEWEKQGINEAKKFVETNGMKIEDDGCWNGEHIDGNKCNEDNKLENLKRLKAHNEKQSKTSPPNATKQKYMKYKTKYLELKRSLNKY